MSALKQQRKKYTTEIEQTESDSNMPKKKSFNIRQAEE